VTLSPIFKADAVMEPEEVLILQRLLCGKFLNTKGADIPIGISKPMFPVN
jgi:hypothetical protein